MEDYERITKEIIKIIKSNSDFYELEPEMIDVTTKIIEITDEWIVYMKIISDIENFFDIEFPDDENLCELYDDGTVRDLSDFTEEIIEIKRVDLVIDEKGSEKIWNEFDELTNENSKLEITNKTVDKLLENLERKTEEAKLNEVALNKIRWSEEDKESYKNPL